MNDFEFQADFLRTILKLEHATRIPGNQYLNVRFTDLLHLLVQDLHRKLVLSNIINSRAAAALVGSLDLDELDSGNGLDQLSRFLPNSLAMNQMTRIVIADSIFYWSF
jgi:hypothetical protein